MPAPSARAPHGSVGVVVAEEPDDRAGDPGRPSVIGGESCGPGASLGEGGDLDGLQGGPSVVGPPPPTAASDG